MRPSTETRNPAAWLYPIPPDANEKTVNWEAFLGPAQERPFSLERFFRWRAFWDYSGGIATDLFVHLMTTIHYVMDAGMADMVMASGQNYLHKETHEVPDTLNAAVTYPKEGFTVSLSATFNNSSASESGFMILGTEGALVFQGRKLIFRPENTVEGNAWIVASWPSELEAAYWSDPRIQEREMPRTWAPQMQSASETWSQVGPRLDQHPHGTVLRLDTYGQALRRGWKCGPPRRRSRAHGEPVDPQRDAGLLGLGQGHDKEGLISSRTWNVEPSSPVSPPRCPPHAATQRLQRARRTSAAS